MPEKNGSGPVKLETCELLLLTMFAKRETVAFDTTFANGLYMTADLPSDLEAISDGLQTATPSA